MASDGTEALVYGLVSTASNLGGPMGSAISNQVFRLFRPSLSDKKNYTEDTAEFREVVAWSYALMYVLGFLALLFLYFLPDQKAQAQERKKLWGHHSAYAYVAVVVLGLAFIYSLCVSFLAMTPSTMCLEFAGGDGCSDQQSEE